MKEEHSHVRVPGRGLHWIVGGAIVGGAHVAVALVFHNMNPYETRIFPECIWHQLTGWECPLCGATRALASLLAGDLVRSVTMNPLVIASYVGVAILVGQTAVESVGYRRVQWPLWTAVAVMGSAAFYTGVLRNLL